MGVIKNNHLVRANQQAPARVATTSSSSSPRKEVLLVCADPGTTQMISKLFEKAQLKVTCSFTPEAGLARVTAQKRAGKKFDLVVFEDGFDADQAELFMTEFMESKKAPLILVESTRGTKPLSSEHARPEGVEYLNLLDIEDFILRSAKDVLKGAA